MAVYMSMEIQRLFKKKKLYDMIYVDKDIYFVEKRIDTKMKMRERGEE